MKPPKLIPGEPWPRPHFLKKCNPLWWIRDDLDKPPNVSVLRHAWNQKQLPNLNQFVLGCRDYDHTFQGTKNSDGIFGDGWQFGLVDGWLPLISYRGTTIEAYIGWRPSGALGWAIRKAYSRSISC